MNEDHWPSLGASVGTDMNELRQALTEAKGLYDLGMLEAAGERFRMIAEGHADCGEAWFWLGMLSLGIGDAEGAVIFFEQAHALGLADSACLANLGEAYRRCGNVSAATAVLEQACAADPASFGAWFNLATIHAEAKRYEEALACLAHLEASYPNDLRLLAMQGEVAKNLERTEEALACFQQILAAQPDDIGALLGRADCWRLQEDYKAALSGYQAVLQQDARNLRAHNGLAGVAVGLGDAPGAEAFYRQALAIAPDCQESLVGWGLELINRRRYEEAVAVFQQAVLHYPENDGVWMDLGEAYYLLGRYEQALKNYQQALTINPQQTASLNGIGNVYLHTLEPARAIEYFEKAAECAPNDPRVCSNATLALAGLGEFDEALRWGEHALELVEDGPDASLVHTNLSFVYLNLGNLERGWQEWDYREGRRKMLERLPYPFWQGESLQGKRILVWQELGIGDHLMFASLLNDLIALAGEVVIECEAKVLTLTRRSFPKAVVLPLLPTPHALTGGDFDFQCAEGSLPRWLRPDIEAFPGPSRESWVQLDTARKQYWANRLAAISDRPKVGVCWRSSLRGGLREYAYADFAAWGELFSLAGVTLINLQYDECAAELKEIAERWGRELVSFPEVDMYNDLDETCALISQLDAVVSAPTAVSRQAGALGIPTYLLTALGDWTSLGTDYDPWMRSMMHFRRLPDEPWTVAVARIVADLKASFAQGDA